ncbi:endonuclease [Flavobacterium sp.]|uniref:endonuclease n=1 Tax=Flavobacterium sp. TaxID=239 RepID=UPI003D6BE983
MKKIYIAFAFLIVSLGFAQSGAPAAPYYNGFNWTLTGTSLKSALSTKIINTHTKFLTYSNVWDSDKIVDLDPNDGTNTNVLLLYGFSANMCPASTSDDNDHRRRNKDSNGGGTSCEWNREHTYAKSLGTPALDDGGASDAGEDVHHLRAADVQRNGARGNRKFASGSGNSANVGADWYPGDEWKGDVARMMMYMYLRYPTQCLPINVGTGTTVATDTNMINLFLQWNAEDPVSQYEDNRNTYIGNASNAYGQGNRNPFIDNPYLATVIWGGPAAENRWPTIFLSTDDFNLASNVSIYPNPTSDNKVNIETNSIIDNIELIAINGQIIQQIKNPKFESNLYTLDNLPKGFYFVKISSENTNTTKKVIVN